MAWPTAIGNDGLIGKTVYVTRAVRPPSLVTSAIHVNRLQAVTVSVYAKKEAIVQAQGLGTSLARRSLTVSLGLGLVNGRQ